EASTLITEAAHEDAEIIFGAVIDENMKDNVSVTVIATGFGDANHKMVSDQISKLHAIAQAQMNLQAQDYMGQRPAPQTYVAPPPAPSAQQVYHQAPPAPPAHQNMNPMNL